LIFHNFHEMTMISGVLAILYEKYEAHAKQLTTLSIYPSDVGSFDAENLVKGGNLDFEDTFGHIESLELVGLSELKWEDMLPVFKIMPNLKELNLQENVTMFDDFDCSKYAENLTTTLTENSIEKPSEKTAQNTIEKCPVLNLQKLIITATNVDFLTLTSLLSRLPHLKVLYMSGNKLTVSDTAPLALKTSDFVGSSILTELYLSRNDFTSLLDITPIGDHLFPKLEKLSLSECPNLTDFDINTPRSEITSQFQSAFPNLKNLSISHCPIREWYTIEFLGLLETIEELSIDNLPVFNTTQFDSTFNEDEILKRKRYLLIANLPKVKICNRSEISNDERTDAERFAIRYFTKVFETDTWKCPSLYRKLTEKHGLLEPVAEVDMRPENKVEIFIELVEDGTVVHKYEFELDLRLSFEKVQAFVVEKLAGFGVSSGASSGGSDVVVSDLRWFVAKHFCPEHNSEIKKSRSKQVREKKMFKIGNWENGDILRCCY